MERISLSLDVLDNIARHCPRALETYLHVWLKADNDGVLVVQKDDVVEELCLSFTKFCNDLRTLSKEDLLKFNKSDIGVVIQLADT